MIEVEHSGDKLPIRRKVKVWNTANAYAFIQNVMKSKNPRGMRLRYSADQPTSQLWLEARNTEPVRIAMMELRNAGHVR